jgi:integrase/recombinase XerD
MTTVALPRQPASGALASIVADPASLRAISGWLLEQDRPNTRTAYAKDAGLLAAFLAGHGVSVLGATRQQVAAWAESMRRTVREDGSRVISEATIARRLSSASSFFSYAVETGGMDANPIKDMKRPKRQQDEDTIAWLSRKEMMTFLEAAQAHSRRAHAIAAVMLTTGARTTEVLAADVGDLGYTGGHRVLTVVRKGNKRQHLPVAPWVGVVLDTYLDGRTDGPLFATAPRDGGRGRLDEPGLYRLIRRIALRAKLPQANALHPHSLRHSALTEALERGCSLRDVQALAGHVDPRTTERYDRMRSRLDHSPVYALAASLASAGEP